MTQVPAVEAIGLRKAYGGTPGLTGLDLEMAPATILALLGPNGAGKTTAVRLLSTLLAPDSGQARVAGYDIARRRADVRRCISLTGQYAALDELQSARENLHMVGRLRGLGRDAARRRSAELIERFDLGAAADRRVAGYSGGMRRRLDLAMSLVADPAVLFLDEPTTGLDPRGRVELWAAVRELVERGVSVFLTTQYLEEADQLADHVAVLDGGTIVAQGTVAELKRRVADQRLVLRLADCAAFAATLEALGAAALASDPTGLTVTVATDGSAGRVRAQLDALDPERTAVAEFTVAAATLDDVFFTLTGHAPETAEEVARV